MQGSSAASPYPSSSAASAPAAPGASRARPRVVAPEKDPGWDLEASSSSTSSGSQPVDQSIVDHQRAARAYAEALVARVVCRWLGVRGASALVARYGGRRVLDLVRENEMLVASSAFELRRGAGRYRPDPRFTNPGGFVNWALAKTAPRPRR